MEIRENGEANSYTIIDGKRWIAQIQINGEFTVQQQREFLNDSLKAQAYKAINDKLKGALIKVQEFSVSDYGPHDRTDTLKEVFDIVDAVLLAVKGEISLKRKPSNIAFEFGIVKNYKVGDVVVWRGYGPAILRVQNDFSCLPGLPETRHNARVNDKYNSCHYSNLRPATADEVELLGDKDCYLL